METLVELEGFNEEGEQDFQLEAFDEPEGRHPEDAVRIRDKSTDHSVMLSRSELVEAVKYLEQENELNGIDE